ncbi:HXXEE domain-containing protein [Kaistia algarum]|uniref:HXXEE domain-containing protein n=1 Tax=Kaistia algarum TaxID=2083279 RepID=UPI000CE75F02|nr:HXXEE domain-containing protein [Kaistia algarum]MCX5515557.1 HXXEE domain-containing protein [Kaistia algarum]PPE81045.1 HXXEE domain-containing protein [Kaistia algarum]
MSLSDWAWLALGAYTIHICEEYFLNWRDWARAVVKLPVTWADFAVTNGAVIALGIVQGELASTVPLIPLVYAALLLINATFFHVAPVIWTKGRYSPGVATAVVLFYPTAIGTFVQASREGSLTTGLLIASFLGGAALMALPITLIKLRSHRYFQQS